MVNYQDMKEILLEETSRQPQGQVHPRVGAPCRREESPEHQLHQSESSTAKRCYKPKQPKQDGPRVGQGWSRVTQDGPKVSEGGSRVAQRGSRVFPDGPRDTPCGPGCQGWMAYCIWQNIVKYSVSFRNHRHN